MIVSLFAVLVIVAVGGRATDALRLSQAESILARLSEADARAYYDILRRRVRKVIVMRALALILVAVHLLGGAPAVDAGTMKTPLAWIATAALATLVVLLPPYDEPARRRTTPHRPCSRAPGSRPRDRRRFTAAGRRRRSRASPTTCRAPGRLINDGGDVISQGTWSARRAKRGFAGKWSARAATGGLYTGTFEAPLPGFKGKTLRTCSRRRRRPRSPATGEWVPRAEPGT